MRLDTRELAQVIVALADRMVFLRESQRALEDGLATLALIQSGGIEVSSTYNVEERTEEVKGRLRYCIEQQEAVAAVQRKLDLMTTLAL